MAATEDLMADGMPASMAKLLGLETAVTGLTATGSNQSGALSLTSSFSVFGTVGASTGCICSGNKNSFIYNGGVSTLSVYPPVGFSINGTAVNSAISVPAGKGVMLFPARGLNIAAIVSA